MKGHLAERKALLLSVSGNQSRPAVVICSHWVPGPRIGWNFITPIPTNKPRRDFSTAHRRKEHAEAKVACLSKLVVPGVPVQGSNSTIRLFTSGWQGTRAPLCGCSTWASRKAIDSTSFFFFFPWDFFAVLTWVLKDSPLFFRGSKPATMGLPADWGFWASSPQLTSRGTRAGHGESSNPIRCPSRSGPVAIPRTDDEDS
ncbi:hypothetical protein CORC01_12300 [Colletotrichum orchidophilum]|uniref:Uncharacterized protein n=1 Tax=Colletotrichum orchidophilum TaxID=1209926 RepID=A0A1G4ATF4_9PEZI|nr:uncharacterized protein CORC01_12300 [Colletotrichum orchidophilum]OHE92373.1 hypothetical protein CORC01_12300 [Colletotrichum orchidophilum]